tara:strand:- start:159 stop:584 length:426 start_codon:yes stop_codon:yes gene_type:complete
MKKELLTLYVLREYICNDIIIKIIESSKKDNNVIENLTVIHNIITRPQGTELDPLYTWWIFNSITCSELSQCIEGDASKQDIFRMIYLKTKMSKKEYGHYSKHTNTWIKFQYHLTMTGKYSKNETYGFNGVKKFSDVLYLF